MPEQRYIDALMADLEARCRWSGAAPCTASSSAAARPACFRRRPSTACWATSARGCGWSADCEITLEANPGTFEKDRFSAFRSAGVNRLSIGVQSFNDAHLKALGRVHDSAQAIAAVEEAAQAFDTFNLDIMYALPGQTLENLAQDMRQALALAPPHISIYHLTIEPNTYFAKFPPGGARGRHGLRHARPDHRDDRRRGLDATKCRPTRSPATAAFTTSTTGSLATTWASARARTASSALPTAWCARCVIASRRSTWKRPWRAMPWRRRRKSAAPICRSNSCSMPCGCATASSCRSLWSKTGLPFTAIQKGLEEAERKGLIERDFVHVKPTERGFDFLNDLQSLFLAD